MDFSFDNYVKDSSPTSRPYLDSVFQEQHFPILDWQMSLVERFALISILDRIRPTIAIEIGTHRGGSLQVLSHFSERVISIDVHDYGSRQLSKSLDNVQFHVEDSKTVLPGLIDSFNETDDCPEFILVDGDHSEAGVRADLNAILKIKPKREMVILCHDSFNPHCRKGMLEADWGSSPYVQFVEMDFVPGGFVERDFDTSSRGEMWGGFAMALLSARSRNAELTISQSRKVVFTTTLSISAYRRQFAWYSKYVSQLNDSLQKARSYCINCRPARYARRILCK